MAGNDEFTTFLSHMDGSDTSKVFTDVSIGGVDSPHTITSVGHAQLDTAQKKFGTASLLLDGTGDYITIPDSSDWAPGTGDFTIDFWVRFNVASGNQGIILQGSGSNQWYLFKTTSSMQFLYKVGGTNVADYSTSSSFQFTANVWTHFAFVRNGSDALMFKDGIEFPLNETTPFGNLSDISAPLWFGRPADTNDSLDGWVDEIRFSKGIARWTANFTPPTSEYSIFTGFPHSQGYFIS